MALGVIFNSFLKALGQMGDPRFRKVLVLGLGLTFGLLIAVYIALIWLLNVLGLSALLAGWFGEGAWINAAIGAASLLAMMIASVFLMVPVASAFTSMFLDQVADAVEDRHFSHLPPADAVPFSEALRDTLSFLGVLILANLLALALYLVFVPLAPLIFWSLNGFLLGREYFTLVAIRRVGRSGAKSLRRKHMATIWAAGFLMAIPLSVPVLNLLVPILGAATFTHVYHKLGGQMRA